MKRLISLALLCAVAGAFPASAAPPPVAGEGAQAAPGAVGMAPGMKAGMTQAAGKRGASRRMSHRRAGCVPMLRDYYWLDYSRMGMGRAARRDEEARKAAAGDGKERQAASARMNRRMRILRLKHGGFPPRRRGCPACARQARMGAGPSLRPRGQRNGARSGRAGRRGADPALARADLWLETPDNQIHRIDPKKPGVMRFNARMWGLYRVFAHLDGGVRDGLRRRYFAYYDLFSHGDEAAKKQRPVIEGEGYWKGRPEFLLERVYETDRQRFSARTGETAKFRLTFRGEPVKGACVVMITQKNWRNAKKTDENGEVSFFLIKETPNESGWRARRRSEKYLVAARWLDRTPGEKDGQAWKATRLAAATVLRVWPSRLEWESKSTAFIVGSFTVIAAGAAIAIRRSRRRKRGKGAA